MYRTRNYRTVVAKSIVALLSVVMLLTQAGCLVAAAAAVGAGGALAYKKGDTEVALSGDVARVTRAAERAAQDLELKHVATEGPTPLEAKVYARTATGAEVTVVARSQTESTSLVSVRVGTFGDAALQGAMLQKMRDHLKADAATRPAPSTGPAPVHVVDTEASRA
jgi:hypothetical protein